MKFHRLNLSKITDSVVIIVCLTSWVNEGSDSSTITAWTGLAWGRGGGLGVHGHLDDTAGNKLYCDAYTQYHDVKKWKEAGHQTAGKQASLAPLYKEQLVLHWESYWEKSLGFVLRDY